MILNCRYPMSWITDKNIVVSLGRIANSLEAIRMELSHPGALRIVLTNQFFNNGSVTMIEFKVVLPLLLDTDVVNRELSVQVGDGPPDVRVLPADATEAAGYSGPQDAPVKLALTEFPC